jgi:glycosyltransferase involved in cell wall biosynthesis
MIKASCMSRIDRLRSRRSRPSGRDQVTHFNTGKAFLRKHSLIFALEKTLGHGTHGANIERAAKESGDLTCRFVSIDHSALGQGRRFPIVDNHSLRSSWTARRGVVTLLRQAPADGLFIHTQVSSLLLLDVMTRVPAVVSMDATPVNYDAVGEAYRHHRQRPTLESAKLAVNRRAFSRAAALTTFSDWAANSLVNDYGISDRKITVIPPGVDLQRFSPRGEKERNARVRLLFVGGDFQRKGGEDLFAAVSQLESCVELDVVTSVPPANVPGGVRIHTGVPNTSTVLMDLFRSADVFVLPTRGDCSPIAIAEAMASGLPVVSCAVGAVAELVAHNDTGLLVPPAAPRELAAALRLLAARHDMRVRMGERGLQLARRRHDAARNVGRLIELVRRTAHEDPRAETSV